MPPHDSDRQVTQLELACVRSGKTLDQVAFLAHPRVAVASPHRWRPNDHRRAAGPDANSAGLETLVTDRAGWNPQAWRGYAERVGQWWRLTKCSRSVTCDIWTHPLGGELRCEVDGEMFGTRANRSLDRFCSMRAARRKAFEAKGWTASGHRGVSLIGSTKSGPQRPSNESHQPTDPAESPRHQVDPGAKNE